MKLNLNLFFLNYNIKDTKVNTIQAYKFHKNSTKDLLLKLINKASSVK